MKTRILLIVMLAIVGLSGNAQVTFQKTYGGTNIDYGYSIQQTTDGGYFIVGTTLSFGAGNEDAYVIKTDSLGDTLWTKTYGGINHDRATSGQQTTDGGYIIAGYTKSFGAGQNDVYLIKTNPLGDTLWTKTYGGANFDMANSVQQTADGGYIITGSTKSFGAGGYDIYLIKTNSMGDTLWTKTYGGNTDDYGRHVQQTTDGGYIIVGETYNSSFLMEVYLIKTDSSGSILWKKNYGGGQDESGFAVQQTSDGGYIVVGNTTSFGAGVNDVYLIKTNANGDTLWTRTYGDASYDYGEAVQQTTDGGYIIVGSTFIANTNYDVYLIKTNVDGDTLWTKTYGGNNVDWGYSIKQTMDGGFVIVGTKRYGTAPEDIYLIKTDSNGNTSCNQTYSTTIVGLPHTHVINPSTQVSFGGHVASTSAIIGSGGIIIDPCTTTEINEILPTPSLLLSPNPFTLQTTLTLQGTYHNPSLFIYNLLGQEVRSIPIGTNKQITIPRSNLPAGMYFYKLIEDNKEVIGIGKLLVE